MFLKFFTANLRLLTYGDWSEWHMFFIVPGVQVIVIIRASKLLFVKMQDLLFCLFSAFCLVPTTSTPSLNKHTSKRGVRGGGVGLNQNCLNCMTKEVWRMN